MGRLAGKYTLITGGTSGIGLATAQAFIAEGARVAVTGRNPDTLAEAERILGDKAWVIPTDAGDITSQKALAETLAARWPRLDAVFLNAGDVTHAPLEAWQEEAWDRLMGINLKGPFFLIQALLPLLAAGLATPRLTARHAYVGNLNETLLAHDADQLDLICNLKAELDKGNAFAEQWLESAVKRLRSPAAQQVAEAVLRADHNRWWYGQVEREWWVRRGR